MISVAIKIQIYRRENAIYNFKEKMLQVNWCKKTIKKNFNKPLILTDEDEKQFIQLKNVIFVVNHSQKKYIRIRDHCHITGKYKGSAHQDCNINHLSLMVAEIKITVIFHNLRGYDSQFIMQEIGEIAKRHTYKNNKGEDKQMDINVIPNNIEKSMNFTLSRYLVFLDSFQFMSSSLDKLANHLPQEAFKYTSAVLKDKQF